MLDPALNHDHAFAQCALQPGERFFAVAPVRDQLGDHGIELCGNGIAFGDAGINSHARTGLDPKTLDSAGSGCKTVLRVLRVQANLDRMAVDGRDIAFEAAVACNMNLKFDEIEARGALGYRMLYLQARVHFHERKTPAIGLIQEFHGAGIVIARRLTQANGGFTKRLVLHE